MCGIAGIWNLNDQPVSLSLLQGFTDAMQHRGPDGGGYQLAEQGTLGLGHRRLNILDLSIAGKQPMSTADGRYTIVYNGEVFNFIELKKELEQLAYVFYTATDTEVILAAYQHWGKDCLYHFNGMWAMAVWDKLGKELWLARDRFGIKPVYYHYRQDQQFAFASETNAFKKLDDTKREFDERNLSLALEDPFLLEGSGKTIFTGIHSVPPGHWVSLKKDGRLIKKQWWRTTDHLQPVPKNYAEQVEHFRELFADACRIRLRSDVSIGTALSGGLDSSAVYCMLQHLKKRGFITDRLPGEWQKAFSAIFPGTEQDEQEFAAEVIRYTGGEIEWIGQTGYDLAEKIIDSTQRLDFVYNTPLFMGADIYAGMRNRNVVVSMDGHGVDEMMFGYAFTVKQYAESILYSDATLAQEYWQIYAQLFLDKPLLPPVLKEQQLKQEKWLWKLKQQVKRPVHTQNENICNTLLYQQFHETMLPTILRNFDKMAMQYAVEIRMPFMDWRLVSYVFSLPVSSVLGTGFTKRILRDAMVGLMPEKIRKRTFKTGLNAPMQSWFSGELRPFLMDTISSTRFQQNGHWDGKKWLDFAEHKKTAADWSFNDTISLWPLINAQLLMDNNLS